MSIEALDRKLQARRRLPTPAAARALREAAGISQEDLAAACGVSGAAISRWEAGLRRPRPEHLERYAEALDRLRAGMA